MVEQKGKRTRGYGHQYGNRKKYSENFFKKGFVDRLKKKERNLVPENSLIAKFTVLATAKPLNNTVHCLLPSPFQSLEDHGFL